MTLNPAKDMQPSFAGPEGKKECPICTAFVAQFAMPPSNHMCVKNGEKVKVNRACKECWEAHISSEIERKFHDEVECMFCPVTLGRAEMKKQGARKDTLHRYSQKRTNTTKYKCQARCQGVDTELQDFSREKDGRVFTCNKCSFQTCVDCDRPEHMDETCEQFKARFNGSHPTHEAAEAKSYDAFVSCPQCKLLITIEKNCGYVQCAPCNKMSKKGVTGGCGHRFCSHCLINWVGYSSAYLGGKQQHSLDKNGKPCKYTTRATDSAHGLKRRFDSEEANDDADDGADNGADDGEDHGADDDEQPVVKKRKTTKKPAAKQKAAKPKKTMPKTTGT